MCRLESIQSDGRSPKETVWEMLAHSVLHCYISGGGKDLRWLEGRAMVN